MEKIFTPNRWFVLFCALLIVVVGSLKLVGDMHLAEFATEKGQEIFSWSWPDRNLTSSVVQARAHVIRRDANDAMVEFTGQQVLTNLPGDSRIELDPKEANVKAVLTFYKLNSEWVLGKVELK